MVVRGNHLWIETLTFLEENSGVFWQFGLEPTRSATVAVPLPSPAASAAGAPERKALVGAMTGASVMDSRPRGATRKRTGDRPSRVAPKQWEAPFG